MALSSRFAIDTTVLLAGAFLTAATLVFTLPVTAWVGFGVFAGGIVLGALGLVTDRHVSGRLIHGLLTAVAIWSLVASLLFVGTTLFWLVFAGAVAVAVIGVADLVAHEVTTERVVHQLEVTPAEVAA